jgi:NADH-quinone oxidoreductase subunit H
MALFSSVSVLPLASNGLMVDTDGSVFIPFISITLSLLVTFLMGINQHSVSGYFGGIRIGAQAISAAFPALISILCAGVRGHGFRWSGISAAQGAWPYQWSAFLSPFEFISFLVFIASGIVMLSNNPAEAGFQTKDIHGGMHAAQTVGRDPAFRLGRVYSVFLWNVMAAVLFLGGWRLPDTVHNFFTETQSPGLLLITETLLVVIKADVLIILTALLCSVSPKIRSDQATDFTWKILSPLNLLCLSGAAIWMSFLAAA